MGNFYAFVTGFSNTKIGAVKIDVKAHIVLDVTKNIPPSNNQIYETQNPSADGYIFKKDATDSSVGLWIAYSTSKNTVDMEAVQLSFVFVGLRDYNKIVVGDLSTYPTQSVLRRDDF